MGIGLAVRGPKGALGVLISPKTFPGHNIYSLEIESLNLVCEHLCGYEFVCWKDHMCMGLRVPRPGRGVTDGWTNGHGATDTSSYSISGKVNTMVTDNCPNGRPTIVPTERQEKI